MKYINPYSLYESLSQKESLMGRILHLYGSIPIPKEKSSVVISKMLKASGLHFTLGEPVSLNYTKVHDRVRFNDYFDSLINSKDSRGHNFEGFVSGIFNGRLTTRGAKPDIIIGDKSYSIKFIDHNSKAPELGSYKSALTPHQDIVDYVEHYGGLTRIFKLKNTERIAEYTTALDLKERIFNLIMDGLDGWIIAYPNKKEKADKIIYHVIEKEALLEMLVAGKVVAPKGGFASHYALALSARFKNVEDILTSYVTIPLVTMAELRRCLPNNTETDWGKQVFGELVHKIRPDVLRTIRANTDTIIKKLAEFK